MRVPPNGLRYPPPVMARLHNYNSMKLCKLRQRTTAVGGRVHAVLGALFFRSVDQNIISHHQSPLVDPRKQPIAHAPRIFLIPWQLFLQRSVFQRGSDYRDDQRHSRRNECPQGA